MSRAFEPEPFSGPALLEPRAVLLMWGWETSLLLGRPSQVRNSLAYFVPAMRRVTHALASCGLDLALSMVLVYILISSYEARLILVPPIYRRGFLCGN